MIQGSVQCCSMIGVPLFKTLYSTVIGGSKGRGHVPGVQILSFSCSFRQKNLQNNHNLGVGAPPRENPGSATGTIEGCEFYDSKNGQRSREGNVYSRVCLSVHGVVPM